MIKKVKKYGTISLLIAMALLIVFAFRIDPQRPGTDELNVILFYLMIPFSIIGASLGIVEWWMIRKEIQKKAI